jgi:hypothetical protein
MARLARRFDCRQPWFSVGFASLQNASGSLRSSGYGLSQPFDFRTIAVSPGFPSPKFLQPQSERRHWLRLRTNCEFTQPPEFSFLILM